MGKQKNPTPEDKIPYSAGAENAVVASCLINPDVYAQVRATVSPEDFHTEAAREAFRVMDKLYPGIDQLTVLAATEGKVPPEYLSSIVARIPTSIHAEYYAMIVARKAYQRRMIEAAEKIAAKAYENNSDSAELFMACQQLLYECETHSAEDITDSHGQAELIVAMAAERQAQSERAVLQFGFRDLDHMTGGMHPGNLIVVGARPGIGKSQILVEVDYRLRQRGKAVMVASAEMTLEEWSEREIAIATGVSVKAQRQGHGPPEAVLMELAGAISEMKHYWLNEPVSISRIVNKARVLHHTRGLDLLIVDYVQLIADTVPKEFGTNIRERVGYISRSLKRLAKELQIPVLAAAQLNREVEGRPDKRPRMADLKESGDIEQDSDIIILMHRPSLYKQNDEPNASYLYVPKIRQIGDVGHVRLVWHTDKCRHCDRAWAADEPPF